MMNLRGDIAVSSSFEAGGDASTIVIRVDADIAAVGLPLEHDFVLFTVGANDANDVLDETTWKGQIGYILDALHTRFANARVGMALPWRRGYDAECDVLAAWITDVVAARSPWAFIGPDERIYLEGGDDGATMTYDGVHPGDLGDLEAAREWLKKMGI